MNHLRRRMATVVLVSGLLGGAAVVGAPALAGAAGATAPASAAVPAFSGPGPINPVQLVQEILASLPGLLVNSLQGDLTKFENNTARELQQLLGDIPKG